MHPDASADGAQHARWVCGACHGGAVQGDASPQCHIEILLPPQTERRDVMNAPPCFRRERHHRSLQHVRHHLTQMRFRDGSSFFPLISFTRFFPLSSRDAKDLRTKLSSIHGLGGPRFCSELQIYWKTFKKTPASFRKDALREHRWARCPRPRSPCCCPCCRTRTFQNSYRRSLTADRCCCERHFPLGDAHAQLLLLPHPLGTQRPVME